MVPGKGVLPFLRYGILCHHVSQQRLETIRVLGRTMQCQVAHDVWTHRDAGVLPADAGSNCPCAASAARICRETFDQKRPHMSSPSPCR